MVNNSGEGFLLTTNFYNIPNNNALLAPCEQSMKGNAYLKLEGVAIKQQFKMITEQQVTWKIHINDLHKKIMHLGEDRMRMPMKHLHYRIKGTLDVLEDCATAKSK